MNETTVICGKTYKIVDAYVVGLPEGYGVMSEADDSWMAYYNGDLSEGIVSGDHSVSPDEAWRSLLVTLRLYASYLIMAAEVKP